MSTTIPSRHLSLLGLQILSFAEKIIPISDSKSLLDLKTVIESSYTDGISAIKSAGIDTNGNIVGVFEDAVSPRLTKRYNFTITDNTIGYTQANPNEIAAYSETITFTENEWYKFVAKTPGLGTKKKNCVKGDSCGATCVKRGTCQDKPLSSTAKSIVKAIKEKFMAASYFVKATTVGTKATIKAIADRLPFLKKNTAPEAANRAVNSTKINKEEAKTPILNYKIDVRDYKQIVNLGKDFASKRLANITEPTLEEKKIQEQIKILKGDKLATAIKTYEKLKGEREGEDLKQFAKLKESIKQKHGITDTESKAWLNTLNIQDNAKSSEIEKVLLEFDKMSGGKIRDNITKIVAERERPYTTKAGLVDVGSKMQSSQIFHELAHHFEYTMKGLAEANREWIEDRSTSKTPEKLKDITGKPYKDSEIAFPGKFISPYVGKIYGKKGAPTEVVSMGVERFANEKLMASLYRKDPEHFYHALGVLLSEN